MLGIFLPVSASSYHFCRQPGIPTFRFYIMVSLVSYTGALGLADRVSSKNDVTGPPQSQERAARGLLQPNVPRPQPGTQVHPENRELRFVPQGDSCKWSLRLKACLPGIHWDHWPCKSESQPQASKSKSKSKPAPKSTYTHKTKRGGRKTNTKQTKQIKQPTQQTSETGQIIRQVFLVRFALFTDSSGCRPWSRSFRASTAP